MVNENSFWKVEKRGERNRKGWRVSNESQCPICLGFNKAENTVFPFSQESKLQ